MSEHYNSDPYALSLRVRKRFRAEKKVDKEKKVADDQIKGKYGLPETLRLVEDDADSRSEAREEWEKGRRQLEVQESAKRRRLALETTVIPTPSTSGLSRLKSPSSSRSSKSSNSVAASLRARILENSARKSDPFTRERNHGPSHGVRK